MSVLQADTIHILYQPYQQKSLSMDTDLTGLVNQLRSTLGKMEVALGALTDAIVWTGSNGKVQWCNGAFDRLVNQPHILVLGAKLSDLLPLTQANQLVATTHYPDARLLNGDFETTEYEFYRNQELRFLEISGNSVNLSDSLSAVLVIRDTTAAKRLQADRQRTEAALRLSEEKFAKAFRSSPVSVILSTLEDGRLIEVNERFLQTFGYTSEEVIGHTTLELDIWVNLTDRAKLIQQLAADGIVRNQEFCLRTKANEIKTVLFAAEIIIWGDQRCLLAVVSDISERKQAEAALQESEQRFRTLVNNIPGIVYRCAYDADWTMEFLGGTVEEITGYPVQDFCQNQVRSWASIIHPEDRQSLKLAVSEAVAVKKPYVIEFRIIHADGTIHWLYQKGQGCFASDGSLLWIDGAIFDISDRQQAEQALMRSEQKYRNIFQNSQVGIGRTRQGDGLFLDANQRCAEILGYRSTSDLIDKQFTIDLNTNAAEHDRLFAELQQHGEVRNFEARLRRPDGSMRWILLSLHLNIEEHCLEFVMTDISERKRLEEELRQSQQFLDSIIDNIPIAVFVKDIRHNLRYVLINQNSDKILGFSREDAIGRNDHELLEKAAADSYRAEDLAAAKGKLVKIKEEWRTTGAGEEIFVRGWKIPLLDNQGHATHLLCISEDITESKRAEEALRQSEVRFRSLYESTSIAVFLQENGIPLDCNRAAEQLFGYARPDLLKCHPRELSPPFQPNRQASADLAKQQIALAYAQGSHRFEWVHRRANGTDFPAEVQLTVFEVEGRKLVQGVVQDLTERKQAEASLKRQAQVESLLSSISRQFIDQQVDAAIQFALESIAQFIGADRSCIFQISPDQQHTTMSHEWCAAEIPSLLNQLRGGSFQQFPRFRQILDGMPFQISCIHDLPPDSAERILFEHQAIQSVVMVPMLYMGKVVGSIGADAVRMSKTWEQEEINLLKLVGELIAMGQARHKAEEKFIKAFRASPNPITITTWAESRFIDVNSSFLRMSDYALEEVIDHTAAELNMQVNPEVYANTLQQALETGSVQNQELEFRTKSGAIKTILLSIELIELSGSQCILNIVNDITERKRLENELISLVSHELRTPMTSLLGALDLLGSGQLGTLSPQGQQVLTIATTNTERLTRLVNDILDLERMRSGKIAMQKVPCNIADLITQAAEAMQAMADKAQVTLITNLDPIELLADPDRLLQTLTNLLSNAIKFSEPGGRLWLNATSDLSGLHLTLEDEGRGIPADKLQLIFDRFQQVDASDSRKKGGTGLGLAICRNIVEQHGGRIWAESVLGQGSTFHIVLPLEEHPLP
jgi:PAS domain S-box-containing protein